MELPGCFATGDDLEELKDALEEAISMYLHDSVDAGTLSDLKSISLDSPPARMSVGEMRVSVPC